jgi:excinuclease ABC subunit A
MGPEGGEEGGRVVAAGTPEEVAGMPDSHTGRFLAELVTPAAAKVQTPKAPGRKRARAKAA